MRDLWLKIDRQLCDEKRVISWIHQLTEDANEFLYYIQDILSLIEYPLYHEMLMNSLIKIFYAPVVVQSLTVFKIKPKMGIQMCLYILT